DDAGRVHETVEPAERAVALVGPARAHRLLAHVAHQHDGLALVLSNHGRHLVQARAAAAGERDAPARGGPRPRPGAADAAPGAGHERGLAREAPVARPRLAP